MLWWAVALLIILNLTTIITMLYHNSRSEDMQEIVIEPDVVPLNGKYFRQVLGFDDRQMDAFREANRTFRQKANVIVDSIGREKAAMFTGLTSENPNRAHIDKISTRIGELHRQLKDATATFYLSLRAICTKQQQVELQSIFIPLFRTTPYSQGQGRGGRYGNRHGNRGNQ